MGRVGAEPSPRRIGILGDVHTEFAALEQAILRLRSLGADLLLCVGDIADGPEDARGADRCCELLQHHQVVTVCGNHDRWLLEGTQRDLDDALEDFELRPESVEFLQRLPPALTLSTPLGRLLLCHGLGPDDMATLAPVPEPRLDAAVERLLKEVLADDYRFIVSGHSHHRSVRRIENAVFINAGTLHRAYAPVFCLLDLEAQEVIFYSLAAAERPGERIRWDR